MNFVILEDMAGNPDISIFQDTLKDLTDDFHENPFEYGNEDMIHPEIYHRLKNELDDTRLKVEFKTNYGGNNWKVKSASKINSPGEVSRVRTETNFIHNGESWQPGSGRTSFAFDLAVFSPDPPLVMQSKQTGPSNYFDTTNSLSLLAEIKHSKNRDGANFYRGGADDIIGLSQFPGQVEQRLFLFFDWWPQYQNGDVRLENYWEKLIDKLSKMESDLIEPVTIRYVPRKGPSIELEVG